jgi:hypothetical protein
MICGSSKLAGMRLQLATVCEVCVVLQPHRETLFMALDVTAGRGAAVLQGLAEVPAVALGVVHCVAACAIGPDPGLGHVRARGLCAVPVGWQVRDRDALQLGDLTEFGGSAEAGPGGAQHDDTAVAEQQFPVPDGPVAARIAHPLGEAEGLDQPVHGRAGIGVQKIGNDLRVWMVLRHGSNFTAGPDGGFVSVLARSGACRSCRVRARAPMIPICDDQGFLAASACPGYGVGAVRRRRPAGH